MFRNRIVLVSGFFDPPHRGHIAYLREAKGLGDRLIVYIHRDACCVKKKGYCFMPLEDRIAIIEALRFVDEVVICEPECDLTSCNALLKIKPNVFAKGGDRTPENMPESEVELCRKLGVEIIYGVGGGKIQSSSWLVENYKKNLIRTKTRVR
ncbi:MAG: adenylyltransferase/cytidyltransferase family protein [Candidatus Bathyarchaeia archaeon]